MCDVGPEKGILIIANENELRGRFGKSVDNGDICHTSED